VLCIFIFYCKINNVHHHFILGLFVPLPSWFCLMVGCIFFSIWTLCNFSPNMGICAHRYLLKFFDELGECHGCFFCSLLLVFVYKYLLAQCTMCFLFILVVFIVTKAHLPPFFLLVCIVDYPFLPLWCSLPLALASLLFSSFFYRPFLFFGGHHNPSPPPSTFLSSCLCCDHPFPLI
jgi:hypothetical protein